MVKKEKIPKSSTPDKEKYKCRICGGVTFYVWLPGGNELFCNTCGWRLGELADDAWG